MTKREMFEAIKNVAEVSANAEMVAFLDHEIELLNRKKSSSSGKPSKKDIENLGIMDQITAKLNEVDRMTATEMVKAFDSEYTVQKISALLKKLVADGRVEKNVEKGVTYFNVVTD